MAVSIGTSRTISGDTFYKNKDFDITFSVVSSTISDTCLYFGNSTYGVLPYVDSNAYKFRAASNTITTVGSLGTLSVDVVALNPVVVDSATAPSYLAMIGMASDPSSNVYFAVANQHRIFRLDPCGTVVVFAGTGTAGDTNGPRLSAEFRAPAGLAHDGVGTLYVTDQYRVRKIANGVVSTLAGSSTQGYADAIGSNAQFFGPGGIALRPNGDLLVSEADSHIIRSVAQSGLVTTYAGSNGASGYVDGSLNTIVRGSTTQVRLAGTSTTLYDTSDLSGAWSSDASTAFTTVYAMQSSTAPVDRRTRILYGGDYSATYSSPVAYQTDLSDAVVGATGFDTSFDSIRSIAYDPSQNVYAAGGIKALTVRGIYHSEDDGATWTTNLSDTTNVLSECRAVAYGNGIWMAGGITGSVDPSANLLISTDASSWTASTAFPYEYVEDLRYASNLWVGAGRTVFANTGIAYSSNNGVSWTKVDITTIGFVRRIAYGNNVWVAALSSDGTACIRTSSNLTTWTNAPVSNFTNTTGLSYSETQRRFLVAGFWGGDFLRRIVVSSNGSNWSFASNANTSVDIYAFVDLSDSYFGSTLFGSARFQFPQGLLYDPSGTLYVADQYNHRIRAVSNGGPSVTTYAGNGVDGNSAGPRLTAALSRPANLARNPVTGVIYVSSFDRHDIRALTSTTLSPYAGTWGVAGFQNGYGPSAQFNGPQGMTVVGTTVYVSDFYNSLARVLTNYPEVRPGVPRVPASGTIIATSNYPITINSRIDVCWTSVGGLIPLYKFEPFSNNSFTANRCGGGVYGTNDVLTYATSSTELASFLTGTGTTSVLFRGSNGPSVAYTYPLTLSVRAVSNVGSVQTVVDDVSTTVTLNPARIIYSPCNANLVFYRNEPASPTTFSLVTSDASLIYSATSLPTGLAFTRTGAQSFTLTGTPTVQTITSNYTILAFDTSSRTYATKVSMVVNPERLLLDVSGSLTQSGVLATSPITPITFSARFPPYTSYRAMRYTWSPPPPAGLQFRDVYGIAISGSSYAVDTTYDASFSLTLAGTITEAQLRSFALTNTSSYSITLTGSRTAPLPALSPSLPRTITLSFGETIFFTPSVPPLFVGLTLSNSYFYSAKTYFPSVVDTSITNIAITDGFLPDGLAGQFVFPHQRYEISGTPVTAATFPFTLTATNGAGTTSSFSVAPTISNDSVTIAALQVDTCYNFIQSRALSNAKAGFYPSSIRYSVASASGCNVTVTGTTLPAGVTLTSGSGGAYDVSLVGRPTTETASSLATLTAQVPATGVSAAATFRYSVSAETFFFPSPTFAFTQNVPTTPIQIDVSTLSETSVTRFSSPNIPAALQITNTGSIRGTLVGSNAGTFDVTAFTPYTSGSKTYSYTVTPDKVLLQPTVYTTVTAPGCNVSIPITGYSLSALTVSNYRFQSVFPYGLTVNPTTGLLSGTLASSLPASTGFTVLGSVGIVDGSLTGTMTTTNLTTSRAQLIEIQDQSNLRVYYSDDLGSNWSLAYSSNALVAARVGVNRASTYLIPTSSDLVLRSSTGSSYTTSSLGQSAFSPLMTAVAHDPSSSTWWIAGTLSNGGRSVYVFKSIDDGLTWDAGTMVVMNDRSGNMTPGAGVYNPYLYGGLDLAYRDGVLLLCGDAISRSVDGGATWTQYLGNFTEHARFSLDQGEVWLVVGSSVYYSRYNSNYDGDALTILYSTDQGGDWYATVGSFNMNAYEVVYGNGVWLASGLHWTGSELIGQIRYSFDGVTWAVLTSIPDYQYASPSDVRAPGALSSIAYTPTGWKIIVAPDQSTTATLYSHPLVGPIDSDWTITMITGEFPGIGSDSRFSSFVVQTVDPGADVTTITFPPPTTGPTFVSPGQTTYVVWQYMPIPAITFTATGTAPISYFASELPVGLTWNSTTRSLSGACMRLGTQSFTIYATDGLGGVTAFTIVFIVDVPRIVRQQSGAGAYTALVRDYTEVAAAINARDTRVNPTEEAALGSFASPYAPDVVTPSNCPC